MTLCTKKIKIYILHPQNLLKMSANRIFVEKDQQLFDDGDKDQRVVNINSLDNDSLANIFMLLSIADRIAMEEVCSKWKEACKLAWHDIKKYKCKSSIGRSYNNCLLTQSYLETILSKCGIYLLELSLSKICNSSIMPFVANHCKNLTKLECEIDMNSSITNTNHFVQGFTQLNKLKNIKLYIKYNENDCSVNLSEMINSLSEEIDEIHLLFPHFRSNPKNNIFFTLKKFKRLQSLTLIGCNVDNIFREISEKTTLVYLDIKLFELYQSLFMFNQLVNLEHLNITVEHDIVEKNFDTNVLINIFSTCKKLKYLDLPFGLYDVTKIPLKYWKNLENLEHLSLCNVMTYSLQTTITKYCKNLKYLQSNLELGENIGKLTELENLECLILFSSGQIGGDSIIAISNNCKKLKRLDISSSTFIGSIYGKPLSSAYVFDELSKLQYLEHLELSRIQNLKDNSIIAIAKNCKNLNYLGIGICPFITEKGLDALTSLKNLHELNISQLNITDNFIIKLKGFKKLYCAGCCKLTDAGIIQLIKNNPDLEHLDISWAFGCTTDLVITANQETENRTNGIILYIKICRPELIEAFELMNKSQWLVIE